jgi:hypothetical protein
MAKILALCFLLTGQLGNLPDHFLPFLGIFDYAGSPAFFHRVLQFTFVIAATSLFFNYRVRTSCLVLGAVVLIGILSSRTYFQNNRTFTGCLWFLTGLYVPGQTPWMVRWQVILLYFGAGFNKLLDADWRSGQFFENMEARLGSHRSFYISVSSWLPAMWMSKLMSWTVIITEFIIAGGFLFTAAFGPIAWLGIAYHTSLVVLTGYTFGMFYYSTASSFLCFAEWPHAPILISGHSKLVWLLQVFDLEGVLHRRPMQESEPGEDLHLRFWAALHTTISGCEYEGLSALYRILVWNPLTYFGFATLLAAPLPSEALLRRVLSILFLAFISPALLARAASGARKLFPRIGALFGSAEMSSRKPALFH